MSFLGGISVKFQEEFYPYEIVERQEFQIGRINVVKDTIKIGDNLYPYTFTRTKQSVCVFPVCEKGVVAIWQYRHSINKWVLEVPAGGVDIGEMKVDAAKRELMEETGYVVDEMIDLGEYLENEGISSSYCQLYFARCHYKQQPNREETELIETRIIPFDEFERMIKSNQFHLIIGIVAWYRARENKLIDY